MKNLLILLFLALVACTQGLPANGQVHPSPPPTPSTPSPTAGLTGTWKGSFDAGGPILGEFLLMLWESGGAVSGVAYEREVPPASVDFTELGLINGTLTDNQLSLSIGPTAPGIFTSCYTYEFHGRVTGNTYSGVLNCHGGDALGQFNFNTTKQ